MMATRSIETTSGMVFDVSADGSSDALLVLMPHGVRRVEVLLECAGPRCGGGRLLRRSPEPTGICRRRST
jgi:hypothetical protein